MEQESWKMDKEETGRQLPEGPILCPNNCGFFGSTTTMNLCSLCYRDVVMKQAKAAEAAATAASSTKQSSSGELPAEVSDADAISAVKALNDAMQVASPSDLPPAQPNRCFTCKKRVGLTGFKCKCGNEFCSLHRYTDKHNCTFDYRTAARDAIAKANPVIKADKVGKI